jgi:hypothetical protein
LIDDRIRFSTSKFVNPRRCFCPDCVGRLLAILRRESASCGVFSVPVVSRKLVRQPVTPWQYVRGNGHVLVTVNFANHYTVEDLVCEDPPDTIDHWGNIPVDEPITLLEYSSDPEGIRTSRLTLVLQVFRRQIRST